MGYNKQSGFTLIEVMIAVAIVAILTSIAMPAYQEQVRTGKRTEGQNLLLGAATKQQRYFSDNMRYTNDVSDLGYADPLKSDTGAYTVTMTTPVDGSSFTITATADVNQTKDNCGNLTLTNTSAKGKTGSKTLAECWK